jgi:hypothetical protein
VTTPWKFKKKKKVKIKVKENFKISQGVVTLKKSQKNPSTY